MKKLSLTILLTAGFATMANAQATRTWVSGVGDDVNPCSRTAPCKTFAGAISKTAAHGEIDVLDPGGFGAVTITKSLTIDGKGNEAGVLNAGGITGILINAATTDVVVLRNLEINGVGTGLNGVRVLQANRVEIENCAIFGQSSRGVLVDSITAVKVFIRNSSIYDINATAVAVLPSSGSPAHQITIDHSHISACGSSAGSAGGVFAQNGAKVVVYASDISQNTASGVEAGAGADITVDDSVISFNGGDGVKTSGGTGRVSRTALLYNTGSAVNNAGGTLTTFGDNRMAGNGTNNTGTGAVPGQQ
jgi:hypothetical protein